MSDDNLESSPLEKVREVFSFPHPVNETAARCVAAMVAVLSLAIILTDLNWLMFLLTYGFLARVLTGPSLSPMGQLATRILAPKLSSQRIMVAGPPKRFAQFIGLVFSATALGITYGLGFVVAGKAILAVLLIFAIMESSVGFCAGCFVFGYLMKAGLVPEATCQRCADIHVQL